MKYKKYVFTLFLGLILATSSVHADTIQEQYVLALRQIITLLQQQVQLLVAQLNALQIAPPPNSVPQTVIEPIIVPPAPILGTIGSASSSTPTQTNLNTYPEHTFLLETDPSSPSSPISLSYINYLPGVLHNSIFVLGMQNYNLETLNWANIQFHIVSDEFSSSDIKVSCSSINYDVIGCPGMMIFSLINPHVGKLHIIITSTYFLGIKSGNTYQFSNLPLDSKEIVIQ